MFDIATMYLGVRLGLYRSLSEQGPATASELSGRTRLVERYVREWLEQQAVSGILGVDDPSAESAQRRYGLPATHAEVLLDQDSLNFLGPYLGQMISVVQPLPALMRAFREGGGVPYTSFGPDCRDGIAAGNRVQFINLLGRDWLPAIPELDARLRSQPAATIADIGCGFGWSTISIARAYPLARIDAFDLDDTSIAAARGNAREAGVEERIRFEVGDAAELTGGQRYDLVVAFETIHDMARPVDALKTMRELTKPNGFVLVVDENVGDRFSVDPGDVERLYYGFSVLHCLPTSMAEQPSAGTGTVMRTSTLQRYARDAGFREVTVLPIAHDFWRFYQLIA